MKRVYRSYEIYFLSSRRRHTRYWRDWSSDVCSSDLPVEQLEGRLHLGVHHLQRGFASLPVEGGAEDGVALEAGVPEIGRASCRARVEISVVAVSLKEKSKSSSIEYQSFIAIVM